MKKIAAKIKIAWRKASCLLAIEGLLPFAGLLVARPALRPMPVRAERVVRYSKLITGQF
jgi:hypothetical protein